MTLNESDFGGRVTDIAITLNESLHNSCLKEKRQTRSQQLRIRQVCLLASLHHTVAVLSLVLPCNFKARIDWASMEAFTKAQPRKGSSERNSTCVGWFE